MKKILLVEDDTTMQSLLKTLFEIEGFETVICTDTDSQNIFQYLDTHKPDVVIMDVHLRNSQNKEINGIEILKVIKNNVLTRKIKVLMASGMDLKDKCLAAGADKFLQKPYMPDELISWLKLE